MKNLAELVGAQLLSFGSGGFTVRMPDMEVRSFRYVQDEGDCCGFNSLDTTLLINRDELRNNPVITAVHQVREDGGEADSLMVTFFGLDRKLAEINSFSSSGSGWCYGATVSLECMETSDNLVLTSY